MWIALAIHFDGSITELGWSFSYEEAEFIGWSLINELNKPIQKLKIKWDGNRGLAYSLALHKRQLRYHKNKT